MIMSTWHIPEADSSRYSTSKGSLSTEPAPKFRLNQEQAVCYDQIKKETRERERERERERDR